MKKLSKREWVAVFTALGLLTYLLFSDSLIALFNQNMETTSNNPIPQTGYSTQEVTLGGGTVAAPGDRITAHYVGKLPNGQVFDSSLDRNTPISFTLGVGQVIRGWDEGLRGMRVGGKRVITIAPDYGYGAQGVGTIPPNSTLVFEVELLNVEKPQ